MIRGLYGMTMADFAYNELMLFQKFKDAAAGIHRHGDLPSLMREVTPILKYELNVDLEYDDDTYGHVDLRPENIETDVEAALALIFAVSSLISLSSSG